MRVFSDYSDILYVIAGVVQSKSGHSGATQVSLSYTMAADVGSPSIAGRARA
jgi:hypothetical protein